MAAGFAKVYSNDLHNHFDFHTVTLAAAGTLNGAVEGIYGFPPSSVGGVLAGNGWELISAVISAGVNTTHTDPGDITATVEKNTDGGESALETAPHLLSTAGTGRRTTFTAGTGITVGVPDTVEANRRFADSDVAFVTLSETGSAGTDPSDVAVVVTFKRIADYDPELTTART
jgi:hypothetical protein